MLLSLNVRGIEVRKRPAVDELHRVVVQAVVVANAENRDDVGVMQPGSGFCFLFEAGDALGVEQRRAGEDFEGDVTAQGFLGGFEDHTHSAAADFADDFKVSEPFNLERLCRAHPHFRSDCGF